MSRRAAVRLLAVLILAACAASAHAQGVSSTVVGVFFGGGSPAGPQPVSATYVEANFGGSVVVSFHGDPATGCAREGLCGYSGVIVWRPSNTPGSSNTSLEIIKLRQHHRILYDAQLSTSFDPFSGSSVFSHTRRDVAGGTPGTCSDASTSGSNSSLRVRDGSVSIRILGGGSSLFASRCAGPLDTDLAGAMPVPSLPLSAALKGHRSVDLGGTHDFASGGFAGTVHSTLVLHLLGSQTNPLLGAGNAPHRKAARLRIVSEPLSLVRSSGALSTCDPRDCEPGRLLRARLLRSARDNHAETAAGVDPGGASGDRVCPLAIPGLPCRDRPAPPGARAGHQCHRVSRVGSGRDADEQPHAGQPMQLDWTAWFRGAAAQPEPRRAECQLSTARRGWSVAAPARRSNRMQTRSDLARPRFTNCSPAR